MKFQGHEQQRFTASIANYDVRFRMPGDPPEEPIDVDDGPKP